ncbi:hypothetical protein WMF30_28710 [Sorangium sp. So ce134]
MNLLVFWNELAEQPRAADRLGARQRMNTLVDTFGALRRALPAAPPPRLRAEVPLHGVELAEGYTIANWQVEADQARRLLFLQLAASSPLLRGSDDPAEALDRYGCADCWHEGTPAAGLRAAWAAGELAVSLDTHERWRRTQLDVEVELLDENDALVRCPDVVRHLSAVQHVEAHRAWLQERQMCTVRDGRDIWDRRAELFPRLDLCREVERQLSEFDAGSVQIHQIMRRLAELETSFASWDGRPIHPEFVPSKCTPETSQTLSEETEAHTATRSDGRTHLFSWHVRFTPGAGRIFFDGDVEARRGLIGYIGMKKGGKLT